VNVTLDEAMAFCAWAGLALPTEPQWEKAARGTDGRRYPWGSESPNADGVWRCNYSEGGVGGNAADGFAHTAPVGSFARYPSPYGAHDLAGNAAEWCAGYFEVASYEQYARWKTAPPQSGAIRVFRGGGWYDPASSALAATRHDTRWPSNRSAHLGFRPVTVER
jgi:formylglycine-generating enzyme required for sulfatase activity